MASRCPDDFLLMLVSSLVKAVCSCEQPSPDHGPNETTQAGNPQPRARKYGQGNCVFKSRDSEANLMVAKDIRYQSRGTAVDVESVSRFTVWGPLVMRKDLPIDVDGLF